MISDLFQMKPYFSVSLLLFLSAYVPQNGGTPARSADRSRLKPLENEGYGGPSGPWSSGSGAPGGGNFGGSGMPWEGGSGWNPGPWNHGSGWNPGPWNHGSGGPGGFPMPPPPPPPPMIPGCEKYFQKMMMTEHMSPQSGSSETCSGLHPREYRVCKFENSLQSCSAEISEECATNLRRLAECSSGSGSTNNVPGVSDQYTPTMSWDDIPMTTNDDDESFDYVIESSLEQ